MGRSPGPTAAPIHALPPDLSADLSESFPPFLPSKVPDNSHPGTSTSRQQSSRIENQGFELSDRGPDVSEAAGPSHQQELAMMDGIAPVQPSPSGHRRRKSTMAAGSDLGPPSRSTSGKQSRSRPSISQSGRDGTLEKHKAHDGGSGDDSLSTSDNLELDDMSDEDLQDDEETGLTAKERKKKKGRRRRNTLLDQRVMSGQRMTAEEKKAADQSVFRSGLLNGILVGCWYLFSLSISIYNKWMFSPEHLDFHFPLFTTCIHMLVQFSLSALVLYFMPRFRPRYDSLSNPHQYSQVSTNDPDHHLAESKKPLMTKMFYFTRIGPCGMATGLDIGLGNMSLKFITLTFYTMCKSSSLGFVLIFAFLFRLETPSLRLIAIILTMTLGVLMMVAGEIDFKPLGFLLVISAAFFSGFRWALTQILLLRNPATSNPFSSIFYLAPIMFLSLLIIAVPVEGISAVLAACSKLSAERGVLMAPVIILFPGVLAFMMTVSEFALLKRTSVVTLSICGIFKEVVTISAAGLVFHDPLTPINVSGLCVTILAIGAYNYIKINKMREDAVREARLKDGMGVSGGEETGGETEGEADIDTEVEDNISWAKRTRQQSRSFVTADGDVLPAPDELANSPSGEGTSETPLRTPVVKKDLSD